MVTEAGRVSAGGGGGGAGSAVSAEGVAGVGCLLGEGEPEVGCQE